MTEPDGNDIESCPDFKLPAHFTFDPENEDEQAEIDKSTVRHREVCARCATKAAGLTDEEVLREVDALKPERRPPPPRCHPSMNPGGFGNGRGVYEVEEEMIALYRQLKIGWRRLFQGAFWRLKYMNQRYWPSTIDRVLANRRAYLDSQPRNL